MGCGESKHAVGIENTITKSKTRKHVKKDNVATQKPINRGNVSADAVSDSSNSHVKKNGSKGNEKEEQDKKVEAKSEAAGVAAAPESNEGVEIEKMEGVEADREEVAAAVVVQEEKEEIENEEEEEFKAAAVEAVEEKKDEIKKEEVKADQEEVVALELPTDEFSSAAEKISEGENEGKENEGKEEGLEVDNSSKELAPVEETKQSPAEERTTADQHEMNAVTS